MASDSLIIQDHANYLRGACWTPADQHDFLADLANEYDTLRGDPLKITREQRGLSGEDELHAFLLDLVFSFFVGFWCFGCFLTHVLGTCYLEMI